MSVEKRADKHGKLHLGRFCVPFWRPLDFEGPIRLVFLYVFGATAKTKNKYTNVPLKLESVNNENHRQNEDPLHLALLHVLAFRGSGTNVTSL